MKRFIFICMMCVLPVLAFSEESEIVVGKHYSESEFFSYKNYESIYEFPMTERIVKIFAKKINPQNVSEKVRVSDFDSYKFLVLYDSKMKFLDAIGIYMFSGSYYDNAYSDVNAFCFKSHFYREGNPQRFTYADNNSNEFVHFKAEAWVSDILISGKYLLWSIEMDLDTIYRIDVTTGETYKYKGYFPNVDFFKIDNSVNLGCFKYKDKWYVINDKECVAVDKEPVHWERRRLKNFFIASAEKPEPQAVSQTKKSSQVAKQYPQVTRIQRKSQSAQPYIVRISNGDLSLLDTKLDVISLEPLSKNDLRILRNMIYAKHGYKFKSDDLKEFFRKFSWYKPQYTNVDAMLSDLDLENIKLIQGYE